MLDNIVYGLLNAGVSKRREIIMLQMPFYDIDFRVVNGNTVS